MSNCRENPVSEELRSALSLAVSSDVEFSEESLEVHRQRVETKVGRRPIAVCGVPLPLDLGVVYVRARDQSGPYWYVILSGNSAPEAEDLVPSEEEARQAVLQELKRRYLGEPEERSATRKGC